MTTLGIPHGASKSKVESAYDSPTFNLDMSIKVDAAVGSMSISPSSRDVVLASRQGLHIVDLDNPYDPPRFLQHLTAWSVADVQWSPHASHAHWVVSTSNQKAVVWNLALPSHKAIEHVLHSHTRAITDINFSAHEPTMLATCSIDSFVHCWDLRTPRRPAISFCDWFAGATQVKYNRQNKYILASSHDKYLYIWDTRMGAQAVRKINAHSTKIYGVDWNRTRPSGIITCALDKTVKFWDYERTLDDAPERVIHTSFPVWRARHTPFGWGVLTMPQRGDTSLYLWDRRVKDNAPAEPVAKFTGHTDHVKEFLWRWRGGRGEDGGDDREFQLVSWGMDRDIRLWSVNQEMMQKIGHDPDRMRFKSTREGSTYMTFRDEAAIAKVYGTGQKPALPQLVPSPNATMSLEGKPELIRGTRKDGLFPGQPGNGFAPSGSTGIGRQLSSMQNSGPSPPHDDRRLQKALTGTREGGFMRAGSMRRKEINPIAWMKGVKVGRKVSDGSGLESSRSSHRGGVGDFGMSWEAPENLGDEISLVGSKFPKINFEKVNIATRKCTVSLTGPWGPDDKWVFLRVEVVFPAEYPCDGISIPSFTLEKTNSIPETNLQIVDAQLRRIANAHVNKRKVCLEACLCYLLGERAEDAAMVGSDEDDDSSSDDDEGMVNLGVRNEEEEGTTSLVEHANQASVPLPKACGAMWSHDGRLVCFFPPKEVQTNKGLLSSLAVREGERSFRAGGAGRLWEGFGRLQVASQTSRRRHLSNTEQESSDSSYTSSDGSSDESDSVIHDEPLRPNLGWRLHGSSSLGRGFRRGGSTDRSTQRSTGTGVKTVSSDSKGKNVVSIHDMSHMLPTKKELALQYKIHGTGPDVCSYNAEVAEVAGYPDLADVWRLVEMILCNDVPLELYPPSKVEDSGYGWGDSVLVMARRANLERARRDSGLGLGLDDEDDILDVQPSDWGMIKWGAHPLGGTWLVSQLFAYFEKKADVQMLAMLSCLLSQPNDSMGRDEETGLPVISSSNHDYLPSIDMMESRHSTISISPSHHSVSMTPVVPHGSYSSSAGGHFNSDPAIPCSTGTTPPSSNLRFSADEIASRSLSSSPEQHHHHVRRSTSGMAANFAGNFARAFAPGHSPPTRKRPSPVESMMNLNPLTSGVTWGAITTFGSGSKGASSTITEATSDANGSHDPIHISLYHRDQFDDEAVASVPLLDPAYASTYKAYRDNYANLLFSWELPLHRLEVLKFNSSDHSEQPSSPIIGEFTRGRRPSGWDGLQIAGHCSKCGSVLDVTNGAKGECKSCKRRQVTMTCVVCEVIIKGLYGPCLKCGHVAHADCHRAWFAAGGDGCPTGCGCQCLQDEEMSDEGVIPIVQQLHMARNWNMEDWRKL